MQNPFFQGVRINDIDIQLENQEQEEDIDESEQGFHNTKRLKIDSSTKCAVSRKASNKSKNYVSNTSN